MLCVRPPALAAPELAFVTPGLWKGRTELRVRFLNGDRVTQKRIRAIEESPEGCNSASALQFRFVEDGPSEIRIDLTTGASWSHIGTNNLGIPQDQPTMKLGWAWRSNDDELRRVWLHEAMHALGAEHEHATWLAARSLPFDFPAVRKWCERNAIPYATWEEQWVKWPVPASVVDHDIYDPESITGYYIPAEWMLDRIARGGATRLSAGDRRRLAGQYGPPPHKDAVTFLPVIAG